MNSILLSCTELNKKFFDGNRILHVLKDITLEVRRGEFLAIVGPSGAGKSTLLHLLGGLDEPTSGAVLFEGKDLRRLSDDALSAIRNKAMGFVFQFYHLLHELNALENVVLPQLIKHGKKPARKKLTELGMEELKTVGLAERAAHRPSELSGGEKQRLAIARALMNRPAIVFCDEPTGNLDSRSSEDIFKLLKDINSEHKTTFVVVTHNKELAKISDRIVNIKDGEIY